MKKEIKIIILIIIILFALIIGYFLGFKSAYDKMENTKTLNYQNFYANIKEITENKFLVQGLAINDLNYRGEFSFLVVEETELKWQGESIDIKDLDIGDTISITFGGYILESYPARITEVVRIQLLDDEK